MYKNVSLPSVAESQSSCIFFVMDQVVGPERGPEVGLLPSKGASLGVSVNIID